MKYNKSIGDRFIDFNTAPLGMAGAICLLCFFGGAFAWIVTLIVTLHI